MCIRDSPNAVYLYRDEQSEDKKLRRRKMYNDTWEQDYMGFVEGNSLTSVSYTHLDVYKRQALLCAAVLHIAERRTGWRTPSGCML